MQTHFSVEFVIFWISPSLAAIPPAGAFGSTNSDEDWPDHLFAQLCSQCGVKHRLLLNNPEWE